MSDQDVVRALDDMERMLREKDLEGERVAAWREEFEAAKASAEQGADWAAIMARARSLGKQVDAVVAEMERERDAIRRELDLQARGGRALKSYKPS